MGIKYNILNGYENIYCNILFSAMKLTEGICYFRGKSNSAKNLSTHSATSGLVTLDSDV